MQLEAFVAYLAALPRTARKRVHRFTTWEVIRQEVHVDVLISGESGEKRQGINDYLDVGCGNVLRLLLCVQWGFQSQTML